MTIHYLPATYSTGWVNFDLANYEGIGYDYDDTTNMVVAHGMTKTSAHQVTAGVSELVCYATGTDTNARTNTGLRAPGTATLKIGGTIYPALCFIDAGGGVNIQSPVTGTVTWATFSITYRGVPTT